MTNNFIERCTAFALRLFERISPTGGVAARARAAWIETRPTSDRCRYRWDGETLDLEDIFPAEKIPAIMASVRKGP